MSASEKLKALARGATPGPWERAGAKGRDPDGFGIRQEGGFDWVATAQVSNVSEWRENAALIAALGTAIPQIIAVVEASETLRLPNPTFFAEAYEGETDIFMRSCDRLVAALAALNEALP